MKKIFLVVMAMFVLTGSFKGFSLSTNLNYEVNNMTQVEWMKKYIDENPGSSVQEAYEEYVRLNPNGTTNSAGVDLSSHRVPLEKWNEMFPGSKLTVDKSGNIIDSNGNVVSNEIKSLIDTKTVGRNNTASMVNQAGTVVNTPGDTPEEAKAVADQATAAGAVAGRQDSTYEDIKEVKPTDSFFKQLGEALKLKKKKNGKSFGERLAEKQKATTSKTVDPSSITGDESASSDPGFTTGKKAEASQDPRYRRATKSIVEAWRDGEFGDPDSEDAKATRNYFMANALGTFARNLGRDIGNVGAQFTGGSIDSNRDTADWESRKDEILANEITDESESIENSPAYRKAISEAQNLDSNELNNRIQAITAGYKEEEIRNYLAQQLQQMGMNDAALRVQDRKLALSDTLADMAGDAESGLGQVVYSLLSVLALPGNFSGAVGTTATTAAKVARL